MSRAGSGNRFAARALPAAAVAVALVLAWRAIVAGTEAWREGGYATLAGGPAPPAAGDALDAPWRARLAQNPSDHAALAVLALALEGKGDAAGARAAMAEALRLAPSDRQTLAEAGALQLRAGDESGGLATLRRLADLYPDAQAKLWPIFTAILDGGRRDEAFAAIARDDPRWWRSFFGYACEKAARVEALERVFSVRVAAGKVSVDERRCFVGRLRREGAWARAYQAWLASLPAAQLGHVGYVFNGDFEAPISNLGFDWILPRREGVAVDALPAVGAGGRRALRVEFVNARWSGPPVEQTLMLAPGRYRFQGRGRADRLDTWLGVQWAIYCLPEAGRAERQLARSGRFRGALAWESWDEPFAVPNDCPVQVVRLELANPRADARVPGDVAARLQGVVWFDDLRIRDLSQS